MTRIVLFGLPTSGKSTLSFLAAQRLGAPQISVGMLLREKKQALGAGEMARLSGGQLLDDQFVASFVLRELMQGGPQSGFVLEGFPRNLNQLALFRETPFSHGARFIHLDLGLDLKRVRERFLNRMVCARCKRADYGEGVEGGRHCGRCGGQLYRRQDATPEALDRKLKVFDSDERPMLALLAEEKRLSRVFVSGDPDDDLRLLLEHLGL